MIMTRKVILSLSVLGFLLCLFGVTGFALDTLMAGQQQKMQKQQGQITSLENTLARLQDDDLVRQERGKSLSEAEKENLLRPVNRIATVRLVEQMATAADLEPFVYEFSPEQEPANAPTGLVQSSFSCEGDAPDDVAVISFLHGLEKRVPGRLIINSLALKRLPSVDEGKITTRNLHFMAKITWIASGSLKAEGP